MAKPTPRLAAQAVRGQRRVSAICPISAHLIPLPARDQLHQLPLGNSANRHSDVDSLLLGAFRSPDSVAAQGVVAGLHLHPLAAILFRARSVHGRIARHRTPGRRCSMSSSAVRIPGSAWNWRQGARVARSGNCRATELEAALPPAGVADPRDHPGERRMIPRLTRPSRRRRAGAPTSPNGLLGEPACGACSMPTTASFPGT